MQHLVLSLLRVRIMCAVKPVIPCRGVLGRHECARQANIVDACDALCL